MPKFDALQASLKAAAVGGIFMLWTNITIETFKLSWHIISTSPKKIITGPSQVLCAQNAGISSLAIWKMSPLFALAAVEGQYDLNKKNFLIYHV